MSAKTSKWCRMDGMVSITKLVHDTKMTVKICERGWCHVSTGCWLRGAAVCAVWQRTTKPMMRANMENVGSSKLFQITDRSVLRLCSTSCSDVSGPKMTLGRR